MDVARDVPLAGAAPVVGIAAADDEAVIASKHIRPDARSDFRSRGIDCSVVITAGQGHSREVSRSGHGVHGAEPVLHGSGPDAVQGQRLLVRQCSGSGGRSASQPPRGVPHGVVSAGPRKRDDRFPVHGADGVQGFVNIRQREAVSQVNAQVVGGVHQRFGTEQVLEFLETGEVNQAGSQRHVLQHSADVVHGSIIQAPSVHGYVARNRPGTVGEDAQRFPYREGVLEMHGSRGGGEGAVPRQSRHGHGSIARIQPAAGKRGVDGAGLGKYGAGIDGIGSRKRHVPGQMHPARLGDKVARPGDGVVNDVRRFSRRTVISKVLAAGGSSYGGGAKGTGSVDAQGSGIAGDGDGPADLVFRAGQGVISVLAVSSADGKTGGGRKHARKFNVLAVLGGEVHSGAERGCPGEGKAIPIDGSGVIVIISGNGRSVLYGQRGAVPHDQFLGPVDIP